MKGLVSFFFLNRANIIPNEIPVFNEGHPILLSKPKDELSILKIYWCIINKISPSSGKVTWNQYIFKIYSEWLIWA